MAVECVNFGGGSDDVPSIVIECIISFDTACMGGSIKLSYNVAYCTMSWQTCVRICGITISVVLPCMNTKLKFMTSGTVYSF